MCVSIFTLKMDDCKLCFWHVRLCHVQKGRIATVRQKRSVVCMEKAL